MESEYIIRTTWGPTGTQKNLLRRPELAKGVPEETRTQAGKLQPSSTYGTAVPVVLGTARVPAVLIEGNDTNWVFLVAEGEIKGIGTTAFGNDKPVPLEVDPTSYVPGTFEQEPGTRNNTDHPYLGRAITWRKKNGDEPPPNVSYEVNGAPVDALQRFILDSPQPSNTDRSAWSYDADSCIHAGVAHVVAITPTSQSLPGTPRAFDLRYWQSTNGGRTWTGVSGEAGGTLVEAFVEDSISGTATNHHPRISVDPSNGRILVAMVFARPYQSPATIHVADIAPAGVSVTTLTSGAITGLTYGAIHLSLSAHGGHVWLAWHNECDDAHERYARGFNVSCREGDLSQPWRVCGGGSAFPDNPELVNMRAQQLGIGGDKWAIDLWAQVLLPSRIRCPTISARPDGTAVVAVELHAKRTHLSDRLLVLPVRVNTTTTPHYVQWDSSVAQAGDAQGLSDDRAFVSTNHVAVGWDGNDEAQLAPVRNDDLGGLSFGHIQKRFDIGTGPQWRQAVTRLIWLGSVAGLTGSDWYAIVYPGVSCWGTFGVTDAFGNHFNRWQATNPSWAIRLAQVSTQSTYKEIILHAGNLSDAPVLSLDGTTLLAAIVKATDVWNGDLVARRLTITLQNGTLASTESVVYRVLIAGDDERAYNAYPTPHGLIVHEWGDFDAGDGFTGRYSRLIAYDPTIIPDLDWSPVDIFHALVNDPNWGAWPRWGAGPWAPGKELESAEDMAQTDLYCRAMGFLFSDVLASQVDCWQHLCELFASANCAPVWADGKLEWVPLETQSVTGNGVTWTPKSFRSAPVYHLSRNDFLDSLRCSRRPESEEINVLPIQFNDRSRNYAPVTMDLRDDAGIALRGERRGTVLNCPWITSEKVASLSAWARLRRERQAATTWEFKLPARYLRLTPLDLVDLTDPDVGLVNQVVRITKVVRHRDHSMTITAEELDIVSANVPTPPHTGEGTIPVVRYAPSILDASLLRVDGTYAGDSMPRILMAVAGRANWRGCEVWRRWNGGDWAKVGEIALSCPVGRLIEPMSELRLRPGGIRMHPGLRMGYQDDFKAIFQGLTGTNAIPPPPFDLFLKDRPPALYAVGTEAISVFERDAEIDAATGGTIVWAKTLRRGVWGTGAQRIHSVGEVVGFFGPNRWEWQPDGSGTLEVRFPAKAIPGSFAEKLANAQSYFLEVP